MKPGCGFVIACDRFGNVREHSELIFCDMLGLTDPAIFDQWTERLSEVSIAEIQGERVLMHQFLEWFGTGSFAKSISHSGCDYQANWMLHDSSAGVLKLRTNGELHSISLLIVEGTVSSPDKACPESFLAELEFVTPAEAEDLYETFAKSDVLRLLPLTRRPLVASRYFAEEFDIALRSWRLIRMLSYAFFKTAGAIS